MRFLFLNQYAPPDPAPTARLLGDLADCLRERGHEVEIISQAQSYHARPARGGSRLRRELAALWAILRGGWRAGRPDVVLSLTSPPGLLVVAALLAIRHRAALTHWAMDLYPELAFRLEEIGPGLPYRLTRLGMAWAYRRCRLIVSLDEDMQTHLRAHYGVTSRTLPPWPSARAIADIGQAVAADSPATEPDWTWLYSGNLGRAHEWEPLLEIQARLEAKNLPARLVFQGDGAARAAARNRAASLGLKRCVWKGYAPEDELIASLMTARLLVVTQRMVTQGLLWPSKLALIERLPRPVLWIGPADGAIARRLRLRGGTSIFAATEVEAAARWVENLCLENAHPTAHPAANTSARRSCEELAGWLEALGPC